MKEYKCHKIVHAEPMTRGEFHIFKYGQYEEIAKGDSHNDSGYHVVYSKDTQDEYHSWSPKKAFDSGYTLM